MQLKIFLGGTQNEHSSFNKQHPTSTLNLLKKVAQPHLRPFQVSLFYLKKWDRAHKG